MKKTPLVRKTALKSKVGLKRSRGLKKIRPSVKSAQAKQRKAVKERSGGQCEFILNWFYPGLGGPDPDDPQRCADKATDLAHIIVRRETGRARDLPEVVIHACRKHHRRYDDPLWPVKPIVPSALLRACEQAIEGANLRSPLPASQRKKLTNGMG